VLIEALACGTPVIAYGHGAIPELLDDRKTGFIVHNQREANAAVRMVDRIDRRVCRDTFERRFGAPLMASNYQDLYRQLTARA
jgi:glycosyltransferase involved in cell wall biosynthesis